MLWLSVFCFLVSFFLGKREELHDLSDFGGVDPECLRDFLNGHRPAVIIRFPLMEEDDLADLRYVEGSRRKRPSPAPSSVSF